MTDIKIIHKPKRRDYTVIKVKNGKSALVKVKSSSGKTVVKADVIKGRLAMKKAMRNFKKDRQTRRLNWQTDVCKANG